MSARTDLASESQYITGGETPKGVDVKEERSDAARLSITRSGRLHGTDGWMPKTLKAI